MGISVLLSVYKKENPVYFTEALDSVINQTLKPDEIVIVKDGELTKELEEVIENAKEKFANIVTYQFEKNVQLGRALAKGLEICKNELVARMDTDDISCLNRLEVQYKYMQEHPDVAVCGGWMEEFNDEGTFNKVKKVPIEEKDILQYAKYRNAVNHVTVMFRKSKIMAVGNYQHFPYMEDYYLWCRLMAEDAVIHNLPQVFVKVRVSEDVYDRRGGWKYFLQHYQFRNEQRRMKLLSVAEYPIALALSFGITMVPSGLRRLIYQKVLRK